MIYHVMLNLFQHLSKTEMRSRKKFGMTLCLMTFLVTPLKARTASEFIEDVENIQYESASPSVVTTTASHTQMPYKPADQMPPMLPNQIPPALEILNQQLSEKVKELTGQVERLEHRLLQLEEKTGHPIVVDQPVAAAPEMPVHHGRDTSVKTLGTLPSNALGKAAGLPVIDSAAQKPSAYPEGAKALYDHAYSLMAANDLPGAQSAFKFFVKKYPTHELAGAANFYWGDSYYAEQNYEKAAKRFLLGYQQYKTSEKAPDMLLKLAMSLDQLGEKSKACTTLKKLKAEYPKANGQLLQMGTNMQEKLRCPG